ncbi:hypothetical protein [Thermomonas flagellata]|uniref:hypothetical protein n=1 Tax=Thermomonas flagellata TaxID=2888524 RepID=UPI001F039587|nr:hypothetical protein [Thermomonas flagellata]
MTSAIRGSFPPHLAVIRPGLAQACSILLLLAGCGKAPDAPAPAPDAAPAPQDAAGHGAKPALTAQVRWPRGDTAFALNVCTSIGPHTLQAGGNSADGQWNLVLDGNLLKPGDTGRLTIAEKTAGMPVAYDARLTQLTVTPDGRFSGSGQDAGGAPFTLSGQCMTTWRP